MFSLKLDPRFKDTDGLGHINNGSMVTWMEEARRPVFLIFNPSLSLDRWNLIVARVELDFLSQCYFGKTVSLETGVETIGQSSLTLLHRMYQEKNPVAQGKSVLVHFDYGQKKSTPIPQEIRQKLEEHKL